MPDEHSEHVDDLQADEETQEEQEEQEETTEEKTFTQEELEAKIKELTWRERTRTEKRLAKLFGTKDLKQAAEYYRAGYAVSQASGQPPSAVLQRLNRPGTGTPPATTTTGYPALQQEIQEIKNMLFTQYEQESRAAEEAEAKKEFGSIYDEHREDIEDLADERGLSLADAAAVVLRPVLRDVYEKQVRSKQQYKRGRKVEGTGDAPPKGGEDAGSLLTPEQKRVCQKAGMSYKEYYESLKALGRV